MRNLKLGCIGVLIIGAGILSGCKPAAPGRPGVSPTVTSGSAAQGEKSSETTLGGLDLTRTFHFSAGVGSSMLAPLSFSQQMARSAGGTWIVFAAKPLDDVKWQMQDLYGNAPPTQTVKETLETLRKAGTPIAWETEKGYMLLDIGPPQDLERIRKQPPVETVGILICAETVPELLKAVGDVWHLQIEIAPELIQRRSAFYEARRKAKEQEGQTTSLAADMMNPYSYRRYGQEEPAPESGASMVEFKAVQRLDTDALMQRLAQSLGGEARNLSGGRWQFAPLSDAQKVQAEIARLKGIVDQVASSLTLEGSSYSSRTQGFDSGERDNSPMVIPPLNEEAMQAFDSLGIYGGQALSILTGYLDPEKPILAMPAMVTLGLAGSQEAHSALNAFARRLQTPTKDKAANAVRPLLQTGLIRILARDPDPETRKILADTALDEKAPQQVRTAARKALVKTGDLKPFTTPLVREMPPGERDFLLRYPPDSSGLQPMRAEVDPHTITPLATTRAKDGDVWAVFISSRLGDPNDLWLALGKNHQWTEFLFTGQTYTHARNYGEEGVARPGSCLLEVTDDRIVIRPPGSSPAEEIEKLQKQMRDPKLPVEQRNKLSEQYSRAVQRAAGVLDKARTLSLADLRKDSDQDGLSDLVEKRMGTDPLKADTDGDGLPDDKDFNPLYGPNSARTDRGRILQAIFTALYGADTSPEPIVVALDRADWQEFYGAHGRVLCRTPDDLLREAKHLSSLRILQFGGPKDSDLTILQKDGPCLFNEAHTRAEVHFWQWNLPQNQAGGAASRGGTLAQMMQYGSLSEGDILPTDTLARFERDGDWKLTALKPCRFDSADRAITAFMGAIMREEYGGRPVY